MSFSPLMICRFHAFADDISALRYAITLHMLTLFRLLCFFSTASYYYAMATIRHCYIRAILFSLFISIIISLAITPLAILRHAMFSPYCFDDAMLSVFFASHYAAILRAMLFFSLTPYADAAICWRCRHFRRLLFSYTLHASATLSFAIDAISLCYC